MDGAVVIDGDTIAYAGARENCPGLSAHARDIDGRQGILMPGFYNAHSHAPMTLLRGVGSDRNLMDWLSIVMPIEDRMTDEAIYWGAMLASAEMLSRGTVAFADQYYLMNNVGRAARDAGIRANLCRGCTKVSALDDNRALYEAWNGEANGRIKVFIGIHGEYTSDPEVVACAANLAKTLGTGIHVHVSETRGEVDGCIHRHGVSPVRYFHDLKLFENHTIAAHCVHMQSEDIEILSDDGVYVAHNPASNLKLASGVAPIDKMIKAGVRVALGTDGASSNNTLDMLADMYLASILQKGITGDPTVMGAPSAVRMATRMGALSMGYEDAGLLKAGMNADMALLCADSPNMVPMADPVANIVYAAQSRNVSLTIVDGAVVYEDGAFVLFDEKEVLEKSREMARFLQVC